MTKLALISGSPNRVASLGDVFKASDVEARSLDELDPAEVEQLRGKVDYYIQLGVRVPARGDTVVRRVHSFLSEGLLHRFVTVEEVMPLLHEQATVLLVAGNLPAEVAAPDDQAARLALLRVLAHAMRADLAPNRARIRVVTGDRTDEEIAAYAISGQKDPRADLPPDEGSVFERTYEDWRINVMGLVHVEG